MIDKRKFQCYIIRTVYFMKTPEGWLLIQGRTEQSKVFNSQLI